MGEGEQSSGLSGVCGWSDDWGRQWSVGGRDDWGRENEEVESMVGGRLGEGRIKQWRVWVGERENEAVAYAVGGMVE